LIYFIFKINNPATAAAGLVLTKGRGNLLLTAVQK
jgi:hypothetical protein